MDKTDNSQSVFPALRQYLETVTGETVDFSFRKNHLCPLNMVLSVDNPFDQTASFELTGRALQFGWYPPLSMLFRIGDPRPCKIIKAHYQGIESIKAKVQVAYFAALQQPLFQKILSPAIIGVLSTSLKTEKLTAAMGSMVFGGLGSKVKIFDFDQKTIVSILKPGFDEQFFLNEIKAREKYQHIVPVPGLISSDRKNRFFVEEYRQAEPIRKLDEQVWPELLDLFGKLLALYKQEEVVVMSTSDYQHTLLADIKSMATQLPEKEKAELATIFTFVEKRQVAEKRETLLVQSHGDFWLGNILREKEENTLLVVDWERTGRYSLLHDLFTLLAIYSLEQNNFRYFSEMFGFSSSSEWGARLLTAHAEKFDLPSGKNWLKEQFLLFILERISFSLKLTSQSGTTKFQGLNELSKWLRFFNLLITNDILRECDE